MVLAEKQIPFELISVNLAEGEHKTSDFLEKQPFGQVPVLDDDGFILYESRAIARYLAEKYADQGTVLLPTDLKGKALFEQAASIEFANFHAPIVKIIKEKFGFGKPDKNQPVDEVALAEYIAELSNSIKAYEKILGKQKYLGGDEITLADLFHLAYAPFFPHAGIDVMTTTGPNTARWWNDITSRPTWTKLLAEGIKSTV
ncbi:glutathione S-transferase-like protein [Mycena galopus ATCC 62051]|nr:glutathione S-transferase-like protein [Mycena galopus ATCC 62051]